MESDFDLFLSELGLTRRDVEHAARNCRYIENDERGMNLTEIQDSSIDGVGMFARKEIHNGETIGLAASDGLWTELGRFMNHSLTPNAEVFPAIGPHFYFRAINSIQTGEEITCNYRQVRKEWEARHNLVTQP
jgi:SET domain-containing protein